MAEQLSRSIYHTTLNFLRVMAQQGDPQAVIALKEMEETEYELIDDEEATIQIVIQSPEAEYLVTEGGTMQIPRNLDQKDE